MKIRALILPAVLIVALAGCTSTPAELSNPSQEPTPTQSQQAEPATPSATPPAVPMAVPADCEALISTGAVHREFSAQFAPVPYVSHPEDDVGQNFDDRNGLNCAWDIPQSSGFVSVHVAERDAPSDDAQIAQWQGAGFAPCAVALDACFTVEEETMINTMQTVYALAGGFEIRVIASAGGAGPLLALASEAATNMGYN